MLSKDMQKDIKSIAAGVVILSIVMVGIFIITGKYNESVLWGTLLGAGYAIVNFILLSITVQKALSGGKGKAQAAMSASYTLRLVLTAAVVIFAIKSPNIYYVAAVIPLVFPQLTILFLKTRRKKIRDKKTEQTDVVKR